MTTGTKGSMGDGKNYEYSTWSGVDGKYEVVNGIRRMKYNNFTSMKTMMSSGPYRQWYIGGWNITGWPSWIMGSNDFNLNDTVKLQSKLATKVRNTTLHLGKDVAEGKQTIDMIRNTLFTVAKALASLKNGEPSSALRVLIDAHKAKGGTLNYEIMQMLKRHHFSAKDFASMWLELQYGWIPLLSDVYEASRILSGVMENERTLTVRCSCTRTVRYNASASPSLYYVQGFCYLTQKLSYEFAENEIPSLQRSLGLYDPAGIVWEVVPYSFVVDWFMPIGSYLESLNVLPNLKGRWVLTKVRSFHAEMKRGIIIPKSFDFSGCYLSATYINVVRSHGEGFTFFNIAPPDIKPLSEVFSPAHIYNAVALATQWISGGKKWK